MFGLSKLRLVEIGVALLLTLAALIFVGLTVWAAETGRISVADAWAAPAGGGVAAYMTIANQGHEADVLKRVHSRKAKSVEMAQATMTADGVMQMRKVEDGLPIEAGASLVFEPGGTHLILLGLNDALDAGEQLLLTLEFDRAGPVDVLVPVSGAGPNTVRVTTQLSQLHN
ncbi:MAG: copper chaperone PCu(A)C [Methyloceanibacter sp.]